MEERKRYLIVKTSSLGDIVQAFDAASYLRAKAPSAEIHWVVEKRFENILLACPIVDKVITFDSKKWRKNIFSKENRQEMRTFLEKLQGVRYDALFDLQGNLKSGLIAFFCKTRYKVGFGKSTVPEWANTFFTNFRTDPPQGQNVRDDMLSLIKSYFNDKKPFAMQGARLRISREEEEKIEKLLENPSLQGLKLCVSPFSNWKNKEIDGKELLVFLKKLRQQFGFTFLFLHGTEDERLKALEMSFQFPGASALIDRLSPEALQHLFMRMDAIVCMDSFPLHLAGLTATPVFSLFGPSLGFKYAPRGSCKTFLQGPCPYNEKFIKRCPKLRTCETGDCMKKFKGDFLAAKFATWWQTLHTA